MNDKEQKAGAKIPVTVLTGFLGSGKTTILNAVITKPSMRGAAVIINEFGEIGLDHEFIESSNEELVLISNGCVCCTGNYPGGWAARLARGGPFGARPGLARHALG